MLLEILAGLALIVGGVWVWGHIIVGLDELTDMNPAAVVIVGTVLTVGVFVLAAVIGGALL